MMGLFDRELFGRAVDRRRRRGDDLADPGETRGVDHVERAVDHDLQREPWLFDAVRQPHRREMEDDVDPARQLFDQRTIPHVAFHEVNGAALQRIGKVRRAAAREVVQHDDLSEIEGRETIDQCRPDDARTAGQEHACAPE